MSASRLTLAIAAGLVVGALLFPAGASAAQRPSCEVPRSKTYLANKAVRVFTTRRLVDTTFGLRPEIVLRACFTRHGRSFVIGVNPPVDTAGFVEFANVRLAGSYVALTTRSCDRHAIMCAGGLEVWNVRTRRLVRSADETWASDLELHPNGSVAWITAALESAYPATPTAVRVIDRAGERTLATGPPGVIAPDSLALAGARLYWTEGDVPRSGALQ